MKTHLYRPILLVGAIGLAAATCWGQQPINANVPFGFQISTTEMPAGKYSVRQLGPGSPVLLFNNWEARKSIMVMPLRRGETSSDPRPRLVFHCGETGCALAEVWGAMSFGGVQISPPPANGHERERLEVVYSTPKKTGK